MFYLLIKLDCEDKESAKELREEYAGSNTGSEAMANAPVMTAAEVVASLAGK